MQRLRRFALKDVADIFVGVSMHAGTEDTTSGDLYPVASVGDIKEDALPARGELPIRRLRPGVVQRKHQLRQGDVVLSARGTQQKLAIVREETSGAIATSTLIVVRAGPLAMPEVVFAAISAPAGQAELARRSKRSTSTIALTARDLGAIEIPLPDMAAQERIAALVSRTETYRRTAAKKIALRVRIAREVAWFAVYGGEVPNDSRTHY